MGYNLLLINWRDIAHPEAGGAEVHAHEIFRRIAALGHQVTFLCAAWPGCRSEDRLDGIEILRRGKNMTFNYTAGRIVRGELASRKFDLVVEDLNKIPFCMPLLTRLPRLVLFHHLFGATIFREASPPVAAYVYLWERLIPWIYRNEHAQAVSCDTAEELVRLGLRVDRLRVVYNGVDTSAFTPAPPDEQSPCAEPYILYLGRVKKYKRLDLILRAFAGACAHGLDNSVRMVFAGAGDDYPRLEKIAGKLGIASRCAFRGRVPEEEKIRLFRHALFVVNPSPKEGWGITNLEAAACAAPVLASRSPGLRESVREGVSGFLFAPGDVLEFAEKMLLLAQDRDLRNRLAQGAREFAGEFNWDQSAEKTLDYITDILEHRVR